MSEINTIKTTNQLDLNTKQNANVSKKDDANSKALSHATATQDDTVHLTDKATQLQSLQQTISNAPVVNNERVDALRAAIADGSYQVDAVELAGNIINFETQRD